MMPAVAAQRTLAWWPLACDACCRARRNKLLLLRNCCCY